jgi:hypothetical protein
VDLNNVGFVIVGIFVLTWVVAVAVWHLGDVEEKWSQNLKPVRPAYGSEPTDDLVLDVDVELPEAAHVHADGSIHADGHGHAAADEEPGVGSRP